MLEQIGSLMDKSAKNRAAKVIGTCHAAHPTEGAWLKPLSVGVSARSCDQSRDLIYPTSRDGPLGERPMVPGGRGRTQRKDELRHQMDVDLTQGPVVRAKKAPSAPIMDECDGHLAAGHAEYRGWCPFCVPGRGKNEAHQRIEASRELHLDCAFMGREA